MKFFFGLQRLLLFVFLVGCTTTSTRITLGPGYYGKNKRIKSTFTEDLATNSEEKNRTSEKFLAESVNRDDTLKTAKQEDHFDENSEPEEEHSQPEIGHESGRIEFIKKNIGRIKRTHTILPGKTMSNAAEDGLGAVAIVLVVLIILLLILLSILVFYIIIAAINQAVDDTLGAFGCYVATMTYGSYDHPKVKILRNFRDEFLAERKWGQHFINWYYRHSPSFVKFYQNNRFVNGYLRMVLNIFIFFIRPFYKK